MHSRDVPQCTITCLAGGVEIRILWKPQHTLGFSSQTQICLSSCEFGQDHSVLVWCSADSYRSQSKWWRSCCDFTCSRKSNQAFTFFYWTYAQILVEHHRLESANAAHVYRWFVPHYAERFNKLGTLIQQLLHYYSVFSAQQATYWAWPKVYFILNV